jgi:hypothetical protein
MDEDKSCNAAVVGDSDHAFPAANLCVKIRHYPFHLTMTKFLNFFACEKQEIKIFYKTACF